MKMFSLIFNSIDSIFVVCALLAFLLPIYVLYLSFKRVSEDTWTKITKFRWIIYLLGVLVAYFEYLPVTPYLNVFNYHTLNRFMAFLPWFVLFCLIIFLLSFIAASHYRDASKPTYLVEGFAILLLLFSSFLLLRNGLSEMRNHSLIWLNDGKRIENFVSPFPGVAMYDCSDFTKYYDVIFVPARISSSVARISLRLMSYSRPAMSGIS